MDFREVRQVVKLIKMLEGTDITELEIQSDNRLVKIRRLPGGNLAPVATEHPAPAAAAPTLKSPPPPAPAATAERPQRKGQVVTAPMVGTFYRSPAANAKSFVEVGDMVKRGQVVCIIEAMKLMNEIESEFTGRILEILVENATPVEFGQELFVIEPSS